MRRFLPLAPLAILFACLCFAVGFVDLITPGAEAQAPRIQGVRLYYYTASNTFAPVPATASGLTVAGAVTSSPATATNTFGAVGSVTATASYDTSPLYAQNHAVLIVPAGTVTTCTARLQGSIDGNTWINISGSDLTCTSAVTATYSASVARYVRVNVLTWGGTGTVTASYVGK